ncbi:serine protease [uncultured Sphingomonas sp.]|uniref:S1 family peptidase n=1 Tax=uncultured Sphingomonas sp. TaxID=158754 RepID=UPI0025E43AF9|nr:serine protease [uncultured Sphingomonas sp.]
MRLNLHHHPAYREQFALVEERFNLMVDDEPEFARLVAAGLAFMHAPQAAEKLSLLKANYFSVELLQAMICGGQAYKMGPIDYIWRCLVDRQIVIRATGHMPGAFIDHSIVAPLLIEHLEARTLLNIFQPPSAFVARYRDALVAVDVETLNGDTSRGSGFFAIPSPGATPKLYTCKHNVDPADGITVKAVTTAAGTELSFGTPTLHPSEDIATIPVQGLHEPEPMFRFRGDIEMFDLVYTLGYPLVPCAQAELVGHRGEVNGTARLFVGGTDILLISNLVSPGNSGGPVLDRDGFCVGMSTRWLEGEWDGEKARFSAAIPAALVAAF